MPKIKLTKPSKSTLAHQETLIKQAQEDKHVYPAYREQLYNEGTHLAFRLLVVVAPEVCKTGRIIHKSSHI